MTFELNSECWGKWTILKSKERVLKAEGTADAKALWQEQTQPFGP